MSETSPSPRRLRGHMGAFVLGLAIATATTATAASLVTSKQIKDGTIATKDLSAAVQKQLKKTAAPGAPGPAGATGPAGPAGPSFAASAVTQVTDQSAYAAGAGTRSAFATCPAGTKVIGGGGAIEGVSGAYLSVSNSASDRSGWRVSGYAPGAAQATAYAFCA